MTIAHTFQLAIRHHQAGRLAEAETLYRQILAVYPAHAEAWQNLGTIASQAGRHDLAVGWFQKAISFNRNNPGAIYCLGNAYRALGKPEEAVAAFHWVLQLKPDFPEAHTNLGNALREGNHFEAAVDAYLRAIQLRPEYPEAYDNLGIALAEAGRPKEAIAAFRHSLQLRPQNAYTHNNLGKTFANDGHLDEAIAEYRRALAIEPQLREAHTNLGNALKKQGQFDEAIAAYRRAVELRPGCIVSLHNLGHTLWLRAQLDEAITTYQRLLQLDPHDPDAHNNLGTSFKDQGCLDEAVAAYRSALQLRPADSSFHSNLVYTLHFLPVLDGKAIEEAQQRWTQSFGLLKSSMRSYPNDRSAERRLRIGYVSPNFGNHVVGRNLLPLFKCHDHQHFEIICYSGTVRPDNTTEELRTCADLWSDIIEVPDQSLIETIRNDQIDILIDLTQHLAENRLPVFAHQPAPVQISFAGYPESTGLETIGYRISDKWLEQDGIPSSEGFLRKTNDHEEVYLIDSFWCYDPCGVDIPLNKLPAQNGEVITFGSLNNFCKVNDPLLKLWARVLKAASDSRLIILSHEGSHRQRTLQVLESEGIESHRVEFAAPCPRKEYLELYHRLDIVLDTFPYNGHTTSLDALWMGVPVVSLCGERPVSRAGQSQLSNLGLPELVAFTEDQYVEIATKLAHDIPRLERLRATLRERMEKSVLMDAPHFARQIEACYRSMWRQWCESQTA